MSIHRDTDTRDQGLAHPGIGHPELADLGRPSMADRVWGVTRIAIGFVFFWAFVDKLFGLGFATPSERSLALRWLAHRWLPRRRRGAVRGRLHGHRRAGVG